jgi:hypothetical protein
MPLLLVAMIEPRKVDCRAMTDVGAPAGRERDGWHVADEAHVD